MASKTTLTAANLEALGAARLAALLIEIGEGNAIVKRRIRLELAGAASPSGLAREVRKRLAAIARARTYIDWRNRKSLVDDLETQRRAIVGQLAPGDPKEALELLWRFLDLADPVFHRCDDSSGTVIGIFHAACADLGDVARAARPDPQALALQAFQSLQRNGYGQFDGLIAALTPALGQAGLEHLKRRMTALSAERVARPAASPRANLAHADPEMADPDREVVGWGSDGPVYADDIAARSHARAARMALIEIADAQGDVDAFIAQYDDRTRKVPGIAAEIARRLLATGRAPEALEMLDAAEQRRDGWPDFAWEDARIDTLDGLGRAADAQAARWSCFERSLSASHLRAFLKRLGDFEDVDVVERAVRHAERCEVHQALSFLVAWPALDAAAQLVDRRAAELDGNQYEILTRAASALAGKHPLAATMVLRAMIDFSLIGSRSSRYGHAARHLAECSSLAAAVGDFGSVESHAAYVGRLRKEHGRKATFWSLVSE